MFSAVISFLTVVALALVAITVALLIEFVVDYFKG